MNNFYRMTPKEVYENICLCIKAGLVPFIQGSPGTGKSAIVKKVAKDFNLELIDCRLSAMDSTDLNGLPTFKNGEAVFAPYSFFPLDTHKIPEGKTGWLIFLDEMNSAPRDVQAASYKLILDRMLGMHKLHPNCAIVCAGNFQSDNAITNPISTALMNRVIHLCMRVDAEEWIEEVAIPQGYQEEIIAFIHAYEEEIFNFDPEKEDEAYPTPRSWEFVNRLMKVSGSKSKLSLLPLIAGAIGVPTASKFTTFMAVYKDMITVEDLKRDPDINPPEDNNKLWAIITHLCQKIEQEDVEHVIKFIEKCPKTFQIVFLRSISKKFPTVTRDSSVKNLLISLASYLRS